MLVRGYFLASLPFITSVLGAALPALQSQSFGIDIIDKIKYYCPDLLNANSDTLKLGLAGIKIPGVQQPFKLWTSVDIVNAYNKRIDETQATLKAVIEKNPDAVSFAATLDDERKAGKLRSPLHGLPILLKDTISTGDKMGNTAGSYALVGAKVDESTISKKLRAAGVIVLGKSNLNQWSGIRSTNAPEGWSARGGQTLGAYAANQNPQGSSSGSAVGASVGLAWASIGVETSGSIILPSAYNNIVGIKPTVGLTSRHLTISKVPRQDSVGPMTRTVSDAVALLQIIAGRDEKDPFTANQPFATPPDYSKALNKESLKGKRIGIPRNAIFSFQNAAVDKAIGDTFSEAVKVLKAAGAIIVDNTDFRVVEEFLREQTTPERGVATDRLVVEINFYAEVAKYFSQLKTNPNNITGLENLYLYTQSAGELEQYPEKNTDAWGQLLQLLPLFPSVRQGTPAFYEQLESTVNEVWAEEGSITAAMAEFNVDGFIMPSTFAHIFPGFGGMPIVTVPMGKYPAGTPTILGLGGLTEIAANVPIGLSFFSSKWTEERLIGWAYAFEQKTHWRNKVSPVVKPKTQLWDALKFGR